MAFPKLSRLVACMCDMSMRDFVVESPFVSLLVRPFECCLHFRNVNNNYVNQTSLVLCVLRPGERNGCDSVTTAVSNFLGHWMRVPAPYKQTKNETNATTLITAGSCYREVRWNWKVSTNGQNPTFSHLSARSQLRKWQWPPASRCVARHRK